MRVTLLMLRSRRCYTRTADLQQWAERAQVTGKALFEARAQVSLRSVALGLDEPSATSGPGWRFEERAGRAACALYT